MIVDLDYVLGAFLSQWYRDDMATQLRFKGGTCLRKCYFPDYRFSEDLDFTAEEEIRQIDLEALLDRTNQRIQDTLGLNMNAQPRKMRIVQDQHGCSTIKVRLYYRGPLRRTGAPRAIQLHITTASSEFLSPSFEFREIFHPFGDQAMIVGVNVPCYSLEEILSEKLRALTGQRRFAISRDIFDVHQLITRGSVRVKEIHDLIAHKFAAKGMVFTGIQVNQFEARKDEFKRDWERGLQYLLPSTEETSFEDVWLTVTDVISWIASLE
jgi:predicted nucleotidyltransferase component of viral defense system